MEYTFMTITHSSTLTQNDIIRNNINYGVGSLLDLVVNVRASDLVVREFKFQSHNYVQFRTITLGKGMNDLIPAHHGLNYTTVVLLPGRLRNLINNEGWWTIQTKKANVSMDEIDLY